MRILDKEVYSVMEKIAGMESPMEKMIKFFDDGALEEKIQEAVENSLRSCICEVRLS